MRIARKAGLPVPIVASALIWIATGSSDASTPDRPDVPRLDHARTRRRLIELGGAVLGFRERVVFNDRCLPDAGGQISLARLAKRLGVPPARMAVIEASARRKIITAAWIEGLAKPPILALGSRGSLI